MTHTLCRSDADEILPYIQRLGRMLFAPNIEPRKGLEQLFQHESAEFDLDLAFLSRIDLEDETERFEIVHGSHEILEPGSTVPLSESYCRRTIVDPEGTMAVSDALVEGWNDDPAYHKLGFESYLGTRVLAPDELYGTLCFADTAARGEPFVESEKALLEIYGEWVGYVLTRWTEPLTQETRVDTIDGRTVSSEAIDSMMDALRSPARRLVLITLIGEPTGISIATLAGRLDHDTARMQLRHTDLPKLADSGYVAWDDDAGTVSRGPKFSEVEPLVRLLKAYETLYPE